MTFGQTLTRTAITLLTSLSFTCLPAQQRPATVTIHNRELLRDGIPWVPHGFYQIAFEVAPANLAHADHPFWATAQNAYTPLEYDRMREAGADSVRLQVAQDGADPSSPIYDRAYFERAMSAIEAARKAGLIVIVAVQAETHLPNDKPIDLPDAGTRRVWQQIAPRFARDRGVLFELFNEPQLPPNPPNWQRWKQSMTATLAVVRGTGAENVVIADGLGVGQLLGGAPLLADTLPEPQIAYASHPYALQARGQTPAVWDEKFGNFARRAPVIITEWFSGGYYCDPDTPASSARFLEYLQAHRIGLEVGVWDWASGGFGSARWDFPHGRFSSFAGKSCHQPGYGIGETIHTWYTTQQPPASPQ